MTHLTKINKIFLSLAIIIFTVKTASAENNHKIDSLLTLMKNDKEDTTKVNHLIHLIDFYSDLGDYKTAMFYAKQSMQLAKSIHIGNEIGWKKGIANSFNTFGHLYYLKGNYEEALKNHFAALKLRKEINDSSGIASSNGNIGNYYFAQRNFTEALKYYQVSKKIYEKLKNFKKVAIVNQVIGNIYFSLGNFEKALEVFLITLNKYKELGDKQLIATAYAGIGAVYVNQNKTTLALENLNKALLIFEEISDKAQISSTHLTIGNIYLVQKNIKLAKEHLNYSLKISNEIGTPSVSIDCYRLLSECSEASGDWKNAYLNHKLYKQYFDSIFNTQNSANSAKMVAKYESDIKEAEEKAKTDLESKKQKLIIVFTAFGLLLTLVFAGFIFRSLRNRNKQNKIITEQKEIVEHQKHLVEEKNREITDSIEYALRIQTAILPPQKIVKKYLENSFILYKPKDIVAGDFYWMETIDDIVLFAACDCTGHGVPGAMVSVVCHNALTRAVKEFGFRQPSQILDKTTEIVLENFSKSEEEIHDGMDISICALNIKTKTLNWAGANNSLFLINNGQLIETKADKQCIGYNDNVKPFTNHQFNLQPDTSIYLFTDGFADQFGGENKKKLTKNRFRELLLSFQHLPFQEQARELDEFISNYKKETEQTDDILVIGVRV